MDAERNVKVLLRNSVMQRSPAALKSREADEPRLTMSTSFVETVHWTRV